MASKGLLMFTLLLAAALFVNCAQQPQPNPGAGGGSAGGGPGGGAGPSGYGGGAGPNGGGGRGPWWQGPYYCSFGCCECSRYDGGCSRCCSYYEPYQN